MKPVRVIVAGGRDFNDLNALVETLNKVLAPFDKEDVEFVSGRANGADMLGELIANDAGIPVKPFPARWKDMTGPCLVRENKYGKYNALAGSKRNVLMSKYGTHLVAMWDGESSGTSDMIKLAKKEGLNVTVKRY